ncbi:MAG: hypothetical protein HY302_10285 [Opitutae bacterium]|nr:hypothetical protein [Opitutae bacterium]
MKRSKKISLVLLGGLSVGALTACAPGPGAEPRISPESVYTNDYYLPGAGYYHAPFRAFYAYPYNFFDPQRKAYFYGGQWGAAPYRSVINISAPTPEAAAAAEGLRGQVQRGGFGSTSGSHGVWS